MERASCQFVRSLMAVVCYVIEGGTYFEYSDSYRWVEDVFYDLGASCDAILP